MRRKIKACVALKIPDHILVDIFCRLPAISLIQCRLVCKSWNRFFKDLQSTKDLLSQTLPSPSSSLLIYGSTDCTNITSNPAENPNRQFYYFLRDCGMAFTRPNNLAMRPCPKDLEVSFCVRIVGSCNGLLCLDDLGQRFYICNPMTSEFSLLPTPIDIPRKFAYVLGFGFSPISNVYKVLDIYKIRGTNKVEAMVMTLGSGIWRRIEGNPIVPEQQNHSYMTYLNGCLHWARSGLNHLLIYAFDLESEQFHQLQPCVFKSDGAQWNFGVLRGCLSIVVTNNSYCAGVWMMKDYGVEASWTLKYGLLPEFFSSLKYSQVLKLTEKEEVLLLDEEKGELLAYAPGTIRRRSVKVDNVRVVMHGACDYIPNFLPLNDIISGLAPVTENKAGRGVDPRTARVSSSIVRSKFWFRL